MYRVLRPIYVRTGDVSHAEDSETKWVRVDHWQELGIARAGACHHTQNTAEPPPAA